MSKLNGLRSTNFSHTPINKALGDEALPEGRVDQVFEVWWPHLEQRLESLLDAQEEPESRRSEREMLEEILDLVRGLAPLRGFEELGLLPRSVLERGTYALEVRGHSLIDALMDDGDIVIMTYEKTASDGQLVAAWLKEQEVTTLKRFFREGERIRLEPANPSMLPIYVDPEDIEIQARVIAVIRSLS